MSKRAALLGYVVLIVLLSAGAAQSLSGSNTVFSDDIKDGEVHGADINNNSISGAKVKESALTGAHLKNGTVAGADVQDGSLTGADLKDQTVAGNNLKDDAVTGDQVDESTLVLTCPEDTTRVGTLCFSADQGEANQEAAAFNCVFLKMRLPSITEARRISTAANGDTLWTDSIYYDSANAGNKNRGVVANFVGASANVDVTTKHDYRCVVDAGARP